MRSGIDAEAPTKESRNAVQATIRSYTADDAADCLSAMRRAIATLTAQDYPADQIEAWLARCDSPDWIHGKLTGDYASIVVVNGEGRVVGFSNLAASGHVNMLFVDPDHAGRGLASALLGRIEAMARDQAIPRLFAEVSHTAQPAFRKAGFEPVSRRLVHLGTIGIANTGFEKALAHDAPPPPRRPAGLVQEWVTRFNAGDAEGISRLYHPDAVNHQVAHHPVSGREAIRAMFAAEFAAFEMICIPDTLHEAGEAATLEWQDPQGRRGCGFFTVRDGLIIFQRGQSG